jgi:hypothetical protein
MRFTNQLRLFEFFRSITADTLDPFAACWDRRVTLYRPVGLKELELIAAAAGWRAFPPRLVGQPIFYPVLTHEYARWICANWNATEAESGRAGFVTRFEIDDAFASRYPPQLAGGRSCPESWVPAEELDAFNRHLLAPIEVVESIYGPGFNGTVDASTQLPAHLAPRPA